MVEFDWLIHYKCNFRCPYCFFSNCWNLKHINIPKNVIKIGKEDFYSCRSLDNITIQNKNDKKEFDANVKSTINILKDNDNFIQLIDYSFLQNDLVSFYYFNERKKYQSFYSFLKKKNLYHLKCSEIKNIIIQLNEIIKIFYSNKLPFPFFDICQFCYDIKNKKIKFLYYFF